MLRDCPDPLRFLQIAPVCAASPTGGAELRCLHLARGLAQYMNVTHLGFSTRSAEEFRGPGDIRFISVPRVRSYRPWDLLRGALGPVPFPVLNYTRESMQTALRDVMESARFDVVQIESIHLSAYLPVLRTTKGKGPFIVCDWHNIESELLARSAQCCRFPAGIYLRRQARLLERYERWFMDQCDAHIVVSERDREALLRRGVRVPVMVVDNGVEVRRFADIRPVPDGGARIGRQRVLFVGSMDYAPNVDAVRHFAAEVWPELLRNLPNSTFTIVGRNPAPEVRRLARLPGIEVTGSVADVRPYYREAFVSVVPLRVGGGTRLKILEAMAAGVPVVSTALGAEGLAAVPDRHYFQADTPNAMCARVLEAARGEERMARAVVAARSLVRQRYDWPALADALGSQLLDLLGVRHSRAAAG